ncbi:hypothetical protein NBO_6g0028 [Nosema bombycis CQ1]|uniref:DUF5096 domain-containing protein n=1 Tax=Nosema bombycis (strain CQ1 / CVCC 102059) TaxID=578461 RepID=R0KWL0_NOSB1|nr:hypothetical protein NBO_6g0028 [Nosema bombycis CQ1]|eukprot:EOB15276.1 hypothetical protein NBO_6g0028 [Nosema bombycis CQ1]
MDEYYGMKIKFMTRGGSIHGILKGLDEDKELFMIEIGEEEFKLDVNDVVDMEPEDEEGSTLVVSKVEASKVEEKLKDEKLKDEGSKVDPLIEGNLKEEGVPVIEMGLKEEGVSKDPLPPKDAAQPLKETLPPNDTPTYPLPLTFSTPIPYSDYQSLLSLSFSRFGPTKEEFISISSLNLFKLLKSYFSLNSKIDIVLGEDPLYNSIGLTLGRLLLNNDYDIRVIGSPRNLEIVNYHYLYRENKGITLKKEREDNEFVIDCNDKSRCNINNKKVIFTFGLPFSNTNNINNFIHIAIGLGILEFVKDLKEYFLIDGMINERIYKKIGRTRKGMKSINRIKK